MQDEKELKSDQFEMLGKAMRIYENRICSASSLRKRL
jgi:hypothetical protein